jgi:hypothetical protein
MTEKNYPRTILPLIKKMAVGEILTYPKERSGSIRSIINNYKMTRPLKDFATETIGAEIKVTRLEDKKQKME